MSCVSNILKQGRVPQVYRGETIVCDFTLRDDTGEVIRNISDAVADGWEEKANIDWQVYDSKNIRQL